MKSKLLTCLALLALCGCSSFSTTQTDERINEKTGEKTTVTTKAKSSTFFDSKSNLAKWKAIQSETRQSAEVGGLDQSSSATNIVSLFEAVARGAASGSVRTIIPVP